MELPDPPYLPPRPAPPPTLALVLCCAGAVLVLVLVVRRGCREWAGSPRGRRFSRKRAGATQKPKMAKGWTPARRGTASRAAPWHRGEPKGHLARDATRGRRRRNREKASKTAQNSYLGAGSARNSTLCVYISLI